MNNEPNQPPVDLGLTPPTPSAQPAATMAPAPKANTKKIIMIVGFIIVALGVGYLAKTLLFASTVVCTKESDEEGYKETEKLKATFKNDKIAKFVGESKMQLEDEKTAKTYYEMFKSVSDEYEDKEGVKINLDRNGDTVTFEMTVNFEKMSKSALKNLGYDEEWTKDDFIENYEDQDYSCK